MFSRQENENSAHSMCRLCLKIFGEFEEQIKITNLFQNKILELFPIEMISFQSNLSHVCLPCSMNVDNYSEFRRSIISRQYELMEHLRRLVPKPELIVEPPEKDVLDIPIKVEPIEMNIEPVIIKTEKSYDSDIGVMDYESENDHEYIPENDSETDEKPTRRRHKKREDADVGNVEAPCEICGKIVRRKNLNRHMEDAHMRDEEKSVCDMCGKKFTHRRPLIRHMITHVPKEFRIRTFQCDLCEKRFCTRDGLKSHEKTHTKRPMQPETCHCGKIFACKAYLNQHMRKFHKRHEYEVSCKECGKIFLSMPQLNEHFRIHHTPGQKNKFQCNICGKLYHRMQDVKVHQKHHREKTFLCEVPGCNKKFILPSELNQHIKIVHLNQKDFRCPYEGCNTAFARRTHLKRHTLLIHEGFRRKCPVLECTFHTGRRDFMKTHLKQHANLSREETEKLEEEIKGMGLC